MYARFHREAIILAELLELVGGDNVTRPALNLNANTTTESIALSPNLFVVELTLEQRARLEVEFVGKWVMQYALDARLVGIVRAFKDSRGTGEGGRTIEDDGGINNRFSMLISMRSMRR